MLILCVCFIACFVVCVCVCVCVCVRGRLEGFTVFVGTTRGGFRRETPQSGTQKSRTVLWIGDVSSTSPLTELQPPVHLFLSVTSMSLRLRLRRRESVLALRFYLPSDWQKLHFVNHSTDPQFARAQRCSSSFHLRQERKSRGNDLGCRTPPAGTAWGAGITTGGAAVSLPA